MKEERMSSMGKAKYHWETDLINPPFSSRGSNKEWMELVEKRLVKKRSIFKRYTPLVGTLTVIVLAFIFFVANEDRLRTLIPNWNGIQKAPQTQANLSLPVNSNNSPEKFHVVDGLTIEEGAQIKISKQADLFDSMNGATIALINLPLIPNQDYTGYLGIWDSNGKLIQKFVVEGYNIINPVQIHVLDITGDRNPDIVLETDEHANGGLGVHVLHVYVEDKGLFAETPLSGGMNSSYTVTFRASSNDFIMVSTQDNRKWTIQLAADQLKELDLNLLNQSNPVNVDPISSIDLQNNTIKTKRLIWFGNLQLNSLAILETSYHFEENKWAMQSYSLENIDKSTIITEIK
jgi:hypothetical protein